MTGDFAHHLQQHPLLRATLRAAMLIFAAFVVISMAIGTQHAQRELRIQKEQRASRDLPPVQSDEPLMPTYTPPAPPRLAPTATPTDNDVRNARNLAPPLPAEEAADARMATARPGTDTEAAPRMAPAPVPAGPFPAPSAVPPARVAMVEGRAAERGIVTGIEQYGYRQWELRVRTEGGDAVRLRMTNPPRFDIGARVRFSDQRIELD